MTRQASCPNCGGPIAFELGASYAKICPFCRFSVVRSGAALQAIGQVSDLVPTAPELTVGDRIYIDGQEHVVGGRLQLDHGRGPWDEWYIENTQTRRWGWLAKAQGQWYGLLPQQTSGPVPAWQQLPPGAQGPFLPGVPGMWAVNEQGQSRVLSAEGELPFGVRSGEQGWYVDLAGPNGAFATIDYGDGSEAPKVYVGEALPMARLRLERSAAQRPVQEVDASRLRCPRCGSPVPLQVPDQTQRAACGACNGLLDYQAGQLQLLGDIQEATLGALIPLGTKGKLEGEDVICIGYVERSTVSWGETFRWREYLLYAEGKGYRWLMEDQGHWTWMKPAHAGDVARTADGAVLRSRSYKLFSRQAAHVEHVVGEFYWRVEAGETAQTTDFIAPPHYLGEERNDREVVWTEGKYIEPKKVWKAFGLSGSPPARLGVGFCQPNPISLGWVAAVGGALIVALGVLFGVFEVAKDHPKVAVLDVPMPPAPASDVSPQYVATSTPFEVPPGASTIGLELATSADNQYVGLVTTLVNQTTGSQHELYVETGYYRGYDGGSWSEGSKSSTAYVDGLEPGQYVLQTQPLWERYPQPGGPAGLVPPTVRLVAELNDRSPGTILLCFGLLLAPLILSVMRHSAFEKKRQENSNL